MLKKRLRWVGLNESELAVAIGVSRESISKYAHGRSMPTGENLRKLLEVIEIKKSTKLPKSLENLIRENKI